MAALQNNPNDPQVNLPTAEMTAQPTSAGPTSKPPRGPPLWQIYKQPAPLRVFPFPTLTSNPISYLHLAVAWLNQVFFPPNPEPSTIHNAFWDHETRSIVVTNEKSMTDLWQQGFFGKGNLSRSEPNWLKREQIKQGVLQGKVSEVATDQRREDRMRAKWERARIEQEAIEQKRREEEAKAIAEAEMEAEAAAQAKALAIAEALAETKPVVEARVAVALPAPLTPAIRAPVGPLELLALPNSSAELEARLRLESGAESYPEKLAVSTIAAPVGPLELLALPNSQADLAALTHIHVAASVESIDNTDASIDGSGSSGNDEAETNTTVSCETPTLNRRKSVRFSPKVESTVFLHTDPPSPPRSVASSELKLTDEAAPDNGVDLSKAKNSDMVETKEIGLKVDLETPTQVVVVNKEHLQLAHEEAFFLAFGLGALKVVDSATQETLSTQKLLTLFRQNSYFPSRPSSSLQPDDPFLIHYAVYHHFRSLGFVPRPGIKFGVNCKLSISFFFPPLVIGLTFGRASLQPRSGLRPCRIWSPRHPLLCRSLLDCRWPPTATEVLALAHGS